MIETIKSMPIFEALPGALQKALSHRADLSERRRGETLWVKGGPSDYCAVMTDGLVEISDSNPSGMERTLGIFGPGEVIGLCAVLRRAPYSASAVAATRSVHFIRLDLRGLEHDIPITSQNALQNWYREHILRHQQALYDKLSILGGDSLHFRLVEMFEKLRLKLAKGHDQDHFTIPFSISKTQMAKIVEARVESVIRCLNRWEKAGYLKMSDSGLTIRKFNHVRSMRGLDK